jgi:hypothetical protein
MQAQYHLFFFDFNNVEKQLRNLLEDELTYYGYIEKADEQIVEKKEEKKDEKKKEVEAFVPIDLDRIDTDKDIKDLETAEECVYSKKAHPLFKILKTLLMLAEVFAFKQNEAEATKIYDFIS